jgi:hypothetical protein
MQSTAPEAIGLPATGNDSAAPHADAGAGDAAGMSGPLGTGATLDADRSADLAVPPSAAPLGHDATGRGTGIEGV